MRKFYLSALLCLMAIGANGQTKLDLGGRAQLRQQRLLQAQGENSDFAQYSTKLKSLMHVDASHALAILKVDDDATVQRLEENGVNVMRHTLGFAFVSMPILLNIIESSFTKAMLISLWLFSITFAASATFMLSAR